MSRPNLFPIHFRPCCSAAPTHPPGQCQIIKVAAAGNKTAIASGGMQSRFSLPTIEKCQWLNRKSKTLYEVFIQDKTSVDPS